MKSPKATNYVLAVIHVQGKKISHSGEYVILVDVSTTSGHFHTFIEMYYKLEHNCLRER